MDLEDCPFHCDIVDTEPAAVLEADRKPPASESGIFAGLVADHLGMKR